MIRNVIFDMGGVLINYDPQHFLTREGVTDPADRELIMKHIFGSAEWAMQDWGMLDEEDTEKAAFPELPERLHTVARKLLFSWNVPMEPMPGMAQLMRDCKAAGKNVYLLSNASHRLNSYWRDLPCSELFDGVLISADENLIKPMPEIFLLLLERYGLKAEESIFVDDTAVNAVGARRVGMKGFVFRRNPEELRRVIFED